MCFSGKAVVRSNIGKSAECNAFLLIERVQDIGITPFVQCEQSIEVVVSSFLSCEACIISIKYLKRYEIYLFRYIFVFVFPCFLLSSLPRGIFLSPVFWAFLLLFLFEVSPFENIS